MRARSTWVFMFFFVSALIVAFVLNFALRDIFSWAQIDNTAILGDGFRLSALIASGVSLLLAVFFGAFFHRSKSYVEQVITEFYKVAFPDWKETKGATFTVVIVSIVASCILGVFDSVFGWLTNNNLFMW